MKNLVIIIFLALCCVSPLNGADIIYTPESKGVIVTGPLYLSEGETVGISGTGHHLTTVASDGHLHFHAHSEFDAVTGLTTENTRVVYAYKYTVRDIIQSDNSRVWSGTTYEFTVPTTTHSLIHKAYFQTDTIPASSPVRMRVWHGTDDTGELSMDQTYPSSEWPASTEIALISDDYLELDTDTNYFVRLTSDRTFSLKQHASVTFPWFAVDNTLIREDYLLQARAWVADTWTEDDYCIDNGKLYICNTTGEQTGTFASNSDKWDLLAHNGDEDFDNLTVSGNLYSSSIYDVSNEGLLFTMNFNTGSINADGPLDSSSLKNHGTVSGATHDLYGGFNGGGAYEFDSDAERIDISSSTLNMQGKDELTLSVWIKTAVDSRAIMNNGGYGGGYALESSGRFTIDQEWVDKAVTATTDIRDGEWHHLVGVLDSDGVNNTMTVYVDGVEDTSRTLTAFTIATSSNVGVIGDRGGAGGVSFIGTIDEPRMYERALSADEIASLYLQRVESLDACVRQKDVHVDSSGNIGIGTTEPDNKLTVGGDVSATRIGVGRSPALRQIEIQQTSSSTAAFLRIYDSTGSNYWEHGMLNSSGNYGYGWGYNGVGNFMQMDTSGNLDINNNLNVDGSTSLRDTAIIGNYLVVGHGSPITTEQTSEFQILGTAAADSSMIIGRWSVDAVAPIMSFAKSRNAGVPSFSTILLDNDEVGSINYYPSDGTGFSTLAATFVAEVDDASPAAGDIGMAFVWNQMPGDAGAIAETMRLSAAGNVGIGVTNPDSLLEVAGTFHAQGNCTFDGTGHDSFSDFVANEHTDWTSTSSNFSTTGSVTTDGLNLGVVKTAVNMTTSGESIIGVTDTSAARTINISSTDIAVVGKIITVKDESAAAGTNNIIIATEGSEYIDSASIALINVSSGSVTMYSDGSNLFIISKYK